MGKTRQRGLLVKSSGLELIERKMREKGYNYGSQENFYAELAEIVELTADTIKNIFNPDWGRNPQRNTVRKIANKLQIDPSEIVEGWIKTGIKLEPKVETTQNQTLSYQIFTEMLSKQIKRMTTNPLTAGDGIALEREKMYVPLGLMERRKRPKVKDTEVEKGSRLYTSEEEITRRFENDEFFSEVIEQGNSPKSQGKRIAIIGEPGAGKTTLLQQIVDRVSKTQPEDFIIWVSLADLKGENLESYLLDRWLKVALRDFEAKTESKQALVDIFKTRKVWLLLDGLDEMGINNPLLWIRNQIGQGWLSEARIVLTCRLNVWDNGKNYLEDFDIYRNLDFDEEQVIEFIDKFFEDKIDRAASLREELNKSGKERIRDLIKNPLRLTLLCYAWQRREGALPETKAGLYEWFVETLYEWKSEHFPTTSSQREELSRALGELAKEAIDRPGDRFRLSREQIVKHLGKIEEPLYKLALDIGCLNIVGVAEENPDEEVYAFFHASFQEYFAALVIDDHRFFLNHIVHDPKILKSSYRVFETSWQETLLFWIGKNNRNLISNKNKLIEDLLQFNDACGFCNIYGDLAFLAAAGLLCEFKTYYNYDEIIIELIQFAFGKVDTETDEIYYYLEPLDIYAKKILQNLDENKVILALTNCLSTLNDKYKSSKSKYFASLIHFLLVCDPINQIGISTCLKILINPELDKDTIYHECLWYRLRESQTKKVILETPELVSMLVKKLNEKLWSLICLENPPKQYYLYFLEHKETIEFVKKLAVTAPWDVEDFLTSLMTEPEFYPTKEIIISEILEKWNFLDDIENKSIWYENNILNKSEYNSTPKEKTESRWSSTLKKLALEFEDFYENDEDIELEIEYVKISELIESHTRGISINECCEALKDIIEHGYPGYFDYIGGAIQLDYENMSTNDVLSLIIKSLKKHLNEDYMSFDMTTFEHSYRVVWQCAENMTYPEFYKAWHGQTENFIPKSLQQQDSNIVLENLKTNNPDLRNINIKSLNRETDIDRLAKGFSNRIFPNQTVSIADIYDLENHIQTQTPNLTVIVYGDEPSDSLLQFCEHLGEFARIAIITDRSIEPPLQGFPPAQANLENTLQEWLER